MIFRVFPPSLLILPPTLVRRCGFLYDSDMLTWSGWFAALFLAGHSVVAADVLQLKDRASITGQILAEKRDQVVVDLGYTVLIVPRSQIARITRDVAPEPAKSRVPK